MTTPMSPNEGSAFLFSDQEQIQTKAIATDDLLGLDAPTPPQSLFDPFANADAGANDEDIMSLASELTQGAIALETAESMKMNDAFSALEKMRKANLEIEFGHAIDTKKCVQCIRLLPSHKRPLTPSPFSILKRPKLKKPKPCLMCGCPTCSKHSAEAFKKSKVIICTECSPLFSLDFVIDCVSHKHNTDDPEAALKQRHQIKHMIDVYDRVRLMLEYSSQFIDEIADTLEKMTKKEDKIGLGCNTSGVASGVAGVCAAACFVTPAGPPLLIASLLFSGASQMTSSGNKMVNYYSTPSKIAFKIISLYNLCKSVLTVTTVLRDALLMDHINLEKYVESMIKETEEAVLEMKTGFEDERLAADDNATFEEDEDLSDDESLISASSTGNASTCTGLVTAYSDITELPLVKIDETEELEDQSRSDEILSPGFSRLFSSDDADMELSTAVPQDRRDAKKPVETIIVNPGKTAIVMAAPTTSKPPYRSPTNAKRRQEGTIVKFEEKVSPTKQEQINKLKETNQYMERDDKVGTLARFYSRSSLAGSSLVSATVTMMAAGACLSLVTFAFEANNLASTIKRIQAGSPSKRAQALRAIKEDVSNLPNTNVIVEEWEKYLEVLRERQAQNASHID